MDNVALENLDQHLDNGGVQQLHVLIKELKYCDIRVVEYLLNSIGENETTLELLSDVMENDKEDKVEDDSSILEPISRKDALKATISIHIFLLQYENTTP